jgi:hypothetical protein
MPNYRPISLLASFPKIFERVNTFLWKDKINHLVTKLSLASYSITTLAAVMTQESSRMIYFAYVHSIMSHGVIFRGNWTQSTLIFKIQKQTVRIIMKGRNKDSCCPLFRQLNILPLHSQYILSLSMLMDKNLNIHKFNSAKHSINTRQRSHLYF